MSEMNKHPHGRNNRPNGGRNDSRDNRNNGGRNNNNRNNHGRDNMRNRPRNDGGRNNQRNASSHNSFRDGEEDHLNPSPQQVRRASTQKDKYLNLAKEAAAMGDRVEAEYYLQHADHYSRILLAAQDKQARHNHHQQPRENQEARDGNAAEEQQQDAEPAPRHGRHLGRRHNNNQDRPQQAAKGDEGEDTVPLPLHMSIPHINLSDE